MPLKTNGFAKACIVGLLFLFSINSLVAQKTVSGRVINNTDKQPVEGASVLVKGTTTGTATSPTGTFSLLVPRDNSVLVISGTGFEAIRVSSAGKTNLGDIFLTTISVNLNEIVVTGYSSQRRKTLPEPYLWSM